MGGGNSTPRYTENEAAIDQMAAMWNKSYKVANSIKTIDTIFYKSLKIFPAVPEHGREAERLNYWRDFIEKLLPFIISNRMVSLRDSEIQLLIDKTLERYFIKAKIEGLESNVPVQLRSIQYWIDTSIAAGNPINKLLMNYLGLFSNSMLNNNEFYKTIYIFLYDKISTQLKKNGFNQNLNTDKGFIFFINTLVKIIEDQEINKYADGNPIPGITIDQYTDEILASYKIFEDVDTLKSACKLFLFLYRKKNCTKYIEKNNKMVPDFMTYRKCKIAGFQAINKPQEVLDAEINKEGFKQEKKIENMTDGGIFGAVFKNIKLVFGYILVLVIIGVLLAISPAIYNFIINIIFNYLIPLITYILSLIGQVFVIIGKIALMGVEGLVFLISSIVSPIYNIFEITISMLADLIKETFMKGINLVSNISEISYNILSRLLISLISILGLSTSVVATKSAESSLSYLSILIDMFKNIGASGINTFKDFFNVLIELLTKGPFNLIANISKYIFDNSQNFYMTINNIDE